MDWSAAITAVATLLAIVLQAVASSKAKAEEKRDETNIQQARKALAGADSSSFDAAAADQHDRVQQTLRGSKR